jgi:hypothetical protein
MRVLHEAVFDIVAWQSDGARSYGEPCGRGVEGMLGGEFDAVGEYCIRVLLELEPLVVVLMALGSVLPGQHRPRWWEPDHSQGPGGKP